MLELDLSQVLAQRRHAYGPGRYETLHLVGELDDLPVVTFTAPAGHGLRPEPPGTRATSPPSAAGCASATG